MQGRTPQLAIPRFAGGRIITVPHNGMPEEAPLGTIEVNGKIIEVDDDGFLLNSDDWNVDVAKYYAKAEGLEMNSEHWDVVNFLRDYYKHYQLAPMIKVLVKELGRKFGPEKGTTRYLYELFPSGPAKQACRIAGLPRPTGCI